MQEIRGTEPIVENIKTEQGAKQIVPLGADRYWLIIFFSSLIVGERRLNEDGELTGSFDFGGMRHKNEAKLYIEEQD